MSYRDLLVVLDTDTSARVRIEIAAALAERFAAHLVGLYPLPMPEAPQHFGYYDPALLNPFFEELRARARDAADKTRQAFEHVSGRPILVVPYVGNFADLGRRVVIGWNASREAARAVNDAMPLLTSAETVTVLTIDPREGPRAHGELPGADISLHLARHGVKAEIERTVSADLPVGEVLLSRVADLGADLLVMGAYGHSRARELLLGGATRSLLRSMTLPVLMSH